LILKLQGIWACSGSKTTMPLRSWRIELGEFRIIVWRQTKKGELADFLVALLAWIDDDWECVTRYDCTHGFPHQDVLGKRGGLLYKRRIWESNYEEIFTHAISNCKKNCEAHAEFFREN
jgi:hypothetical protein